MTSSLNSSNLFPRGLLRPELNIGQLCSISSLTVKFNLSNAGAPSGAHFLGSRYGKGEVGEFILIEGQTNISLGRIIEIHLPEADRRLIGGAYSDPQDLDGIGTIQLLGSIAMDTLQVSAGVDSYPRLGDRVYAAPHSFIANLPKFMEVGDSEPGKVLLRLGSIDSSPESYVSIKPEKLFGRHCAILGATGGGKSWTTARIIEECLRYKTKIILLDATGEYRGFDGDHISNVHLGLPVNFAKASKACSLPQTSFIESDFIALFEPAGKVQGPKLRAAMRSLRLATIAPHLATNGIIKKIDQSKASILAEEMKPTVSERIEDPQQAFDVSKLVSQIEQECVWPDGFGVAKGSKDITKWGGDSGEVSYCLSLISRINGVLTSPAFECVFKSNSPPLSDVISSFIANNDRLLRVCLSGVSFEFKAREIVANVIGRHLLNLARGNRFKDQPLVVIVDEAHNFLGRQIGVDDGVSRLDAFELIAKEGRKYGLNICLSTQRPRDITEGVLSQMGALVVHRLTNDRDRDVVERACGEIDRSASSFLPNLKPGEAAIIGADFPIPLTIKISPPDVKPLSDGPNYQDKWKV